MDAQTSAQVSAALQSDDRERYLASLFVPVDKRGPCRRCTRLPRRSQQSVTRVTQPMPGEVRLQWWHDALRGADHGEVERNPVAAALLGTIAQFALPPAPLQRLLSARRFDLYGDPMPDLTSFEGYAGETVSVLHQLSAMVLTMDGRWSPATPQAIWGCRWPSPGISARSATTRRVVGYTCPLTCWRVMGSKRLRSLPGAPHQGFMPRWWSLPPLPTIT